MAVSLQASPSSAGSRRLDAVFQVVALVVLVAALGGLALLVADVWRDGAHRIDWTFLTSYPSRRAERAGISHAVVGSLYVIVLTALLALPLGVAAAVYLEEYGGRSRIARLIELNIANLAAVPSIIYGLLGLGLFVRTLGLGRSVLAGAATLALLALPVVILSTREALRTVPSSIREGSYASTVTVTSLKAPLATVFTAYLLLSKILTAVNALIRPNPNV